MSIHQYPGAGGGTGDIVGPASSTDNAVARFDGVTGKLLQNSVVTVGDTGNVTGVANFTATGTTTLATALSGPLRASSGVVSTGNTSLTSEVSGVLPRANGGTNSSTALSNNRVMVSSGGKIDEASAITAARALISDANGIPVHSAVTSTTLAFLDATSSVQTQLDAKLPKAGGTMTGTLVLAGDPSSANDAATKNYVDSVANGLDVKLPVRVATTANITLSGIQTIDGQLLIATDRVLVKNQSSPSENGIYVSAIGSWTRSVDMDSWLEVPGAFCFVQQGTLYADTGFVCTADAGGTLGVTAIDWSQFVGVGTYTADGQGIELTGTQFSLELDGTTLSKSGTGLKVNGATQTEISYLTGVTSAIQTQLDAKLSATSVAAVSSNITLTNKRIHFVDTTSARSLTLPSPSASSFIVVKDATGTAGTNNITIVRSASEKIETVAASYVLNSNLGSWTFVSNATDWFII